MGGAAGEDGFSVRLGPDGTVVRVGPPLLAGEAAEHIFRDIVPTGASGRFSLYQSAEWLVGAASLAPGRDLATAAECLYQDLFVAVRGWHPVRIWNYVPEINEPGPDGLENYRSFCAGRSRAFEREYGRGYRSFLPSASAVGRPPGELCVLFAASRTPGRNVENPQQVPAYHYPADYGPRAPSFARATVIPAAGASTVFISGTAAIRGHQTVAPDRTDEQLAVTLENLSLISRACGLGADLGAGRTERRHFKVYLRHAGEQARVAAVLDGALLRPGDQVSYVQADICRRALTVEIEAVLWNTVLS
jgi:chorismate lyase / 3-hydroxybenzoate synthase